MPYPHLWSLRNAGNGTPQTTARPWFVMFSSIRLETDCNRSLLLFTASVHVVLQARVRLRGWKKTISRRLFCVLVCLCSYDRVGMSQVESDCHPDSRKKNVIGCMRLCANSPPCSVTPCARKTNCATPFDERKCWFGHSTNLLLPSKPLPLRMLTPPDLLKAR